MLHRFSAYIYMHNLYMNHLEKLRPCLQQLPHSAQAAAHWTSYTEHSISYRTCNRLPHIQQATAHSASKRTFNKLPHIQQATIHPTSYYTFNKLLHIQQATAHSTSYYTFNKLPHIRQATAPPPKKHPAEFSLHASRLMPAIDFRLIFDRFSIGFRLIFYRCSIDVR